MQPFKKESLENVQRFLVKKFTEINVITNINEWQHIKTYYVPNTENKEYKFLHSQLGYMEIKDIKNELSFTIDILAVFRYATKGNDLDFIKLLFQTLVEKHGHPNSQYYEDDEYNLTNATRNGNLEIIEYLVEKGVDIHVPYEINMIEALKNKHYDIARYFLENDPGIDQKVVLENSSLTESMINVIHNWNLYKKLDKFTTHKILNKTKNKI